MISRSESEASGKADFLAASCSCLDFEYRRRPCKHMYLLARFATLDVYFPSDALPVSTLALVSNEDSQTVEARRHTIKNKVKRYVEVEKTLHHLNSDALRMSNYMSDEESSGTLSSIENTLVLMQQLKDKYANNFRTADTQQ
ncbi:hypothetical protein A0J61_02927 [Choanephora cucurbitarum]|uniref:SWIM-type domain-containing protein n=1 Tax=Choanephora cucurbitarum TaxID=101091 RepID=A0A1C7NIZ3_9FUNG|nr:hypothetical protein A0J61_02927 [Choanephora cucurbitarum]